jgi:hypothetical protein
MKAPKDFWTGAIYLAAGLTGVVIARDYTLGTPTRMGPGYFPTVLAGLLALVGLILVVRSFVTEGPALTPIALKPLVLVTASIVLFGLTIEPLGGPAAMMLTILVAAAASREFRLAPGPILAAVSLVCACTLVFIEVLKVPIPLVGEWLEPLLLNL